MRSSLLQIQRKRTCVSEVSLLDLLQMASAFSEARRAARLLQQFGGFHFCRDDMRFSPLFVGFAMHHRPFLSRFVCAAFVSALVRSTALCSVVAVLPRRVSSLVMGKL